MAPGMKGRPRTGRGTVKESFTTRKVEGMKVNGKKGLSMVKVHCSMQVGISRIMGNGSKKSSMEEESSTMITLKKTMNLITKISAN